MRRSNVMTPIAVSIFLLVAAASAQTPFRVIWAKDLLSVRANAAPLADVVAEVGRVAGVDVTGMDKLTGLVTVEFTDVSLQDGFKQLLPGASYVLQEVPASAGAPARRFALRVFSVAAAPVNPPIVVPALEALAAADKAHEAEEAAEAEPDADDDEEKLDEKVEAARLVSEGAFGSDVAVKSLVEHLDDYNEQVRLEAVRALAARPIKVALAALTRALLEDDAASVRQAALEALGQATDPQSLAKMGQLLETREDVGARISALRVLALRADPASVVYLRRVEKDADPIVQQATAQMLAEFDRRAKEAKERAAK